MTWTVTVGRKAARMLLSLPRPQRERLTRAIDRLKDGPWQRDLDVKPLQGRPEMRLRVGDWRVLFLVYANEIRISVVSISPRGDAYK